MNSKLSESLTLSKQDQRRKILSKLAHLFPSAFHPKKKKPLKKGILEELFAHPEVQKLGYSKKALGHMLKWYTQSWGYLRTFEKPNAYRVDLAGQKVEMVTEADRVYAQNKLSFSRQKAEEQKAKQEHKSAHEMPVEEPTQYRECKDLESIP